MASDFGRKSGRQAAVIAFMSLAAVTAPGQNPPSKSTATRSIERGSETERALRVPEKTYQTREERLAVKPLDPKTTSGTPSKRKKVTAAEKAALRKAKPSTSAGGAPNPDAEAEARRRYPNERK